jgi:F420-dependent oxidoreductase-like protein
MRIGLHFSTSGREANVIDEVVDTVRGAAEAGMATVWLPQLMGADALTEIAVAGREVPDIELGTGVVPTYPRHPLVLAGQALTTQAACGNRLALGIGLSHQIVIEGAFGYSFERPARHMREYLSVLVPAMRGERVDFEGETVKAHTLMPLTVAGATPPPVLVAALGPAMLKLTGELADGTVTWMVGPKTLANHVTPSITASAQAAGRPAPRIVVGLPVAVTDDPDGARARATRSLAIYNQLPSYRAMLDREEAEGPGDVAVVGDEASVAKQVGLLADAGATDLAAVVFGSSGEQQRTRTLLSELARN